MFSELLVLCWNIMKERKSFGKTWEKENDLVMRWIHPSIQKWRTATKRQEILNHFISTSVTEKGSLSCKKFCPILFHQRESMCVLIQTFLYLQTDWHKIREGKCLNLSLKWDEMGEDCNEWWRRSSSCSRWVEGREYFADCQTSIHSAWKGKRGERIQTGRHLTSKDGWWRDCTKMGFSYKNLCLCVFLSASVTFLFSPSQHKFLSPSFLYSL